MLAWQYCIEVVFYNVEVLGCGEVLHFPGMCVLVEVVFDLVELVAVEALEKGVLVELLGAGCWVFGFSDVVDGHFQFDFGAKSLFYLVHEAEQLLIVQWQVWCLNRWLARKELNQIFLQEFIVHDDLTCKVALILSEHC